MDALDDMISAIHVEVRELALFPEGGREERRQRLLELLHDALFQAQTDKESNLDYLGTILHGLEKQAKPGETVAEFTERTRAAIAAWERAEQRPA